MKIFVYGTLLKGLANESPLTNSKYLGPAMFNASLFDLGDFPGFTEGNGTVVGELYEVNDKLIEVLDLIEGYNEYNVEKSLFIRKEIIVCKFLDGNDVKAFCYFNNSTMEGDEISHGDYRRYILENSSRDQWIISYGSNISTRRIFKRVGTINYFTKGFIDGYELIFNNKAHTQKCSNANIAYTGNSAKCPIIAYKLTPEQICELDGYEGVPNLYLRITIPFCDHLGKNHLGQVYISHPDNLIWGQSPDPKYYNYIQSGYIEHGYNLNYLTSTLNNSHS